MTRFIFKNILFLALIGGYFIVYIRVTYKDPNQYFNMQRRKEVLMDTVQSPRILFLAGSSYAFGLDCHRIQDSLRVNAVNGALHAGLGLKYILDAAMPYVREGDVVVIGIEYPQFYTQMNGDAPTLGPMMFYDNWRHVETFNFTQLKYAVSGVPEALRLNKMTIKHPEQDFYSVKGFNDLGDEVGHLQKKPVRPLLSGMPSGELCKDYCRCFLERVHQMENKGARVFVAPPALAASSGGREAVFEVDGFLRSVGHPFIFSPDEVAYDDSMFYDTNYHLAKSGVDRYNATLIKTLKDIL